MSQFTAIKFAIEDRVAKIVLDRPDAANALNLDLARDLARAALVCDNDPAVKAVLLTGTGRMFCAGGDLKAFAGFSNERSLRLKEVADEFHKAISVFARMDPVVVIAVNGIAAGAGFSLAVTGDYVVAAQSAKFTMAYTRAGLSPDGSSTWYVPRLVGLRRAQELMLTNRTLTAAEAQEWGLITRVVPDDDLQSEALKVAMDFAKGPKQANANVKRLLLGTLAHSLEEQMELEGRAIAQASVSVDGDGGIRAFLEKRMPVFE